MRNDVGAAAQTYPPEAGNRPRRRLDKPSTVSIGSGKNDKRQLLFYTYGCTEYV